MKPLTQIAHELIRDHLPRVPTQPLLALDATAGNGHDTCFLAELVGNTGHVWAVDIQPAAIEHTRDRLADLSPRVTLIVGNHAHLDALLPSHIHGQLSIAMFNLGYLPGGEKSLITQIDSTIPALSGISKFMKAGGLLSILAYPGHPGGAEETQAITGWIQEEAPNWETLVSPPLNISPVSPRFWLLRRCIQVS